MVQEGRTHGEGVPSCRPGDFLKLPATHRAEIMSFWKMTKTYPYVILNSSSHPGSLMKFMI